MLYRENLAILMGYISISQRIFSNKIRMLEIK